MYYNKFTVVHNTMRNLHMCKFTVYVDQEVCLVSKGLFENMNDELRNLSREMGAIEEFKGNVKDVEEVIENIAYHQGRCQAYHSGHYEAGLW